MKKKSSKSKIEHCKHCKYFLAEDIDGCGTCVEWGWIAHQHKTIGSHEACGYFFKRTGSAHKLKVV